MFLNLNLSTLSKRLIETWRSLAGTRKTTRKRTRIDTVEALESRQLLTTIMSEGFEGVWPSGSPGWSVNTDDGRNWDDNNSIPAHTGSWSGYSADLVGGGGQTSYINNLDTTMTFNADLTDFRNVSLSYWRFLNTEATWDSLNVTVSKAGIGSVSATPRSGNLQSWTQETLQIPESLWGQSDVQVQFRFTSDGSVIPGGNSGVWIDDILLDGTNEPGFPPSIISVPSGTNLRLNQFGDISNVTGSIGAPSEIDTYGFGVDSAGDYTITVAGSAGLDGQLRIYDAAGNALTPIIDNTFGNGVETFTINRPISGEACYFSIGSWFSTTGDYSISVTGPDSFVGTETVASPTYSVTDSGSINFAGDRDYFTFTAPLETTLLSITLNPSVALDSHLTLLDATGAVLATRDQGFDGDSDTLTDFPIVAGTTYVLMVSGFSLSEGSAGSESYDFTIDFNPDDVGDPPSVISVPSGVNLRLNQFGDISGATGNIGSTTDFDTFAFGVETTGSYTIMAGGIDTQLRIYNSNGVAITPIQDIVFFAGNETLTVNLTAGDTCYFVVGGFSGETGNITVSVDGPSVVQAATTFASPNFFVSGTGSINGAGDRDYFNITAPTGTNVLSIALNPAATLDGVISLFNSSGTLLQQRDATFNGGAETITNFSVTAGQNYYVMFSGFNIFEGSTGAETYNYSLDFGPDVVDTNVAPSIPAGQILQIAENTATNTDVGIVVANDANSTAPNNTLTYAILSQSPSNQFSINATTGLVTYIGPATLNFETVPSFTLSVRVSDGGTPSLSSTQNVTVNITNVNEAPTFPAGQTQQVLENSGAGVVVGTVTANDPDNVAPNNTLTYSIVSGNPSNPFSINSTTGQITVANPAALNFEATPTFTLQVRATDGGAGNLNVTQSVVINLIDANDAPSIAAGQTLTVPENSSFGASVGTVLASDPDAPGPNKTLTYSITNGNTNSAFAINAGTGAITVNNASVLDFEATQSYSLTIQVTDGGGLSVSQVVTVNLSNVNEAPTVTAGQTFSLPENSSVGTTVGTVVATDPDASKTLTFSITAGNTGTAFAIDPATGVISVAGPINFETNPTFSLSVRATDGGNLFDTKTVTISLTNVNEAPTITTNQAFSIAENSTANTTVGNVLFTDPDATSTPTFSISGGNTGNAFAINSTTGQISVLTPAALNFETTPSFTLQISLTDAGVAATVNPQSVTVNLTNVNETPAITVGQQFTIAENTAAGTVVGTVEGSDPDTSAPFSNKTFSLTSNPGNLFSINGTTGAISIAAGKVVNFEESSTVTLTVKLADGGTPSLSDSQSVVINITNVNEAPAMAAQSFTINENSAANAVVGTVVASDPEGGALSLSIASGSPTNPFVISAAGVISVASPKPILDFETNPTYTLQVRAADAANNATTATITINLTNINEAPVLGGGSGTVSVNKRSKAAQNLMPNITVTDSDGETDLGKVVINFTVPKGGLLSDVQISSSSLSALGSVQQEGPTSFTRAAGTVKLTITLNDGVTTGQVQDFLRSIRFFSKKVDSANRPLGRTISVQVFDKTGSGTPSNVLTTNIRETSR